MIINFVLSVELGFIQQKKIEEILLLLLLFCNKILDNIVRVVVVCSGCLFTRLLIYYLNQGFLQLTQMLRRSRSLCTHPKRINLSLSLTHTHTDSSSERRSWQCWTRFSKPTKGPPQFTCGFNCGFFSCIK